MTKFNGKHLTLELQSQNVTRKKAFGCKIFAFNVDEIDHRCQFHQCSMYNFYTCRSQKRKKILMTKLYFLRFGIYECKKVVLKTLVKLTQGLSVKFQNIGSYYRYAKVSQILKLRIVCKQCMNKNLF